MMVRQDVLRLSLRLVRVRIESPLSFTELDSGFGVDCAVAAGSDNVSLDGKGHFATAFCVVDVGVSAYPYPYYL